jgi:threonine synthase
MGGFVGYCCSLCGKEYAPQEVSYTCPADDGNLDIVLDYADLQRRLTPGAIEISDDFSIWRYLPLLPVDDPGHAGTPLRAVGWTPLFKPSRLATSAGVPRLWLKDDGRNPTASFKDRASAVAVARAQQLHARVVVTASTGNAGAALAGMAAAAGQPAVILAPKTAPPAKVAQLLMFGAGVYLVDGTYDQAFDLTLEAAREFGWYCRNTGYNPFTAEGKKTVAFEICEQFTRWEAGPDIARRQWDTPEAIFVSVGDGNIISGLHKGLKDLMRLGWIDRMPRLFGIQSTGSAAVYNAYVRGDETIEPVSATTMADSIAVDLPRDGVRAVRAARETHGAYLAVSDDEILSAMRDLAREAAVFAEPAGAAAYAGLVRAQQEGRLQPEWRVLVLNTGNGLKDVRAALQASGQAMVIQPTLSALRKAVSND